MPVNYVDGEMEIILDRLRENAAAESSKNERGRHSIRNDLRFFFIRFCRNFLNTVEKISGKLNLFAFSFFFFFSLKLYLRTVRIV